SCFGTHQLQRMLVGEFLPSDGAPIVVGLAAALLMIRKISGGRASKVLNDPAFILFVLGWILGFRVFRFLVDWSLPALSLWIALELQDHFGRCLAVDSFRRLTISAGLCLTLFF